MEATGHPSDDHHTPHLRFPRRVDLLFCYSTHRDAENDSSRRNLSPPPQRLRRDSGEEMPAETTTPSASFSVSRAFHYRSRGTRQHE